MTWTLEERTVASSGDRYAVVACEDGYFAVSVNGHRPLAFHREVDTALRWIAARELERARRTASVRGECTFTFANERGERTTLVCATRG